MATDTTSCLIFMKIHNEFVKSFAINDTDHTTFTMTRTLTGNYVGGSRSLDGLEKTTKFSHFLKFSSVDLKVGPP
jgi:hypothetical protein